MDFRNAIIQMLGLQDVLIEDLKIFRKDLRIELQVRQRRESCYCNRCGLQLDQVKEWILRKIKAPALGIFQSVTIKLYQMRGVCSECNCTSTAELAWIHPQFHSFSCGFVEVAGRMMEETTCEAVSRLTNVSSKVLWQMDQWRMQHLLQFMKLPKKLDLSHLCADEVHFITRRPKKRRTMVDRRWMPEFVTNLVCPSEGKILFNAIGRTESALEGCLMKLTEEQRSEVKYACSDLHDAYINTFSKLLPNAQVCVDRFHLVQKVNGAFDEVRRSEFKMAKYKKDTFTEEMLRPHRRFVLVSREKNLSKSEVHLLDRLRTLNKQIHTAMLLVEQFHLAMDTRRVPVFRRHLTEWYQLVRQSKLDPFRKVAKTIRKYRSMIEAYIESRLTTAVIEGLNNKIKVLKRMGYGYTNPKSFMLKILQRCGYLNHYEINTDQLMFKV